MKGVSVIKKLRDVDDDHRLLPPTHHRLHNSRGPILTSYTDVAAGIRSMMSAKVVIGYYVISIT